MRKKLLFTISLLISLFFTFTVTFSFATDNNAMNGVNNAINGARNTVDGAENAVEGAVKDITNTTKNDTNDMKNTINNETKTNVVDNNNQTTGYNASRTATTGTTDGTTTGNFLGMSSTMWTWLILAIAVVAIIALVWYYSNQLTNNRRYDDNDQ